jgi:RimJ/RimL family protein N-acetyltransferase
MYCGDDMKDVIIRQAKPQDAEGIIAHGIEIAREPDIYMPYTPKEADVPVEEEKGKIINHLEVGNLFLVAEAEEKIIGVFTCVVDHSLAITRHTAVLGMSVDRNYRNRGIGTEMMERAIRWAQERSIVRLELEVYAENVAAIRLYKKYGFEVEGRKRMYAYQRGRYYDSLIMSRLFI